MERFQPPRYKKPRYSTPKSTEPAAPPRNVLLEEARVLRLKKRFSQNFLINEKIVDRIAAAVNLSPGELVLEIGAGAGFLTSALLRTGAVVCAVELDRAMCMYLKKKFHNDLNHVLLLQTPPENLISGLTILEAKPLPAPVADQSKRNLRLIEGDILRVMPDFILENAPPPLEGEKQDAIAIRRFKIVGNLPYAITSRILFKLAGEIEDTEHVWRNHIAQLTVMVQKEVGERITAKPGEKAYNPLSIALQLRFETRMEFLVPAGSFYPPPKVESAVVTLIPREEPLIAAEKTADFGKLVRAAFSAKRKTIRNALLQSSYATQEVIQEVFTKAGLDSSLRAETLSIQEFGVLTDAFRSYASQN